MEVKFTFLYCREVKTDHPCYEAMPDERWFEFR
jgi:hypothetical protein